MGGSRLSGGIGDLLRSGVPLWECTSIRVGGPASLYAQPATVDQLQAVVQRAQRADCPFVVLGGGSNVVFPDAGFNGLVIRTTGLCGRRAEGTRVRVGAGERLAEVAWWSTKLGLAGLEWACGIPGSIGGAVVMNAGTRTGDIAGVLSSVDVLTEERVNAVPVESLRLGYRTSALLEGDFRGIVVEAMLELRRDHPAVCLERARSSIAERLRKLPIGASAGCIFRNPASGLSAGELLDRAGCKGLRVRQAKVSNQHANVILNEGTNNASDVLELIEQMKHRALDAFGVELHEEVVRFDRATTDRQRTGVRATRL
jgi:UDP-N-acetylmuramate dehydrogenase